MPAILTVGLYVPDQMAGTVFSIHGNAINIRDDAAYQLTSVIDRPDDLTGMSVLVDRLPGDLVVGDRVVLSRQQHVQRRQSVSPTTPRPGTQPLTLTWGTHVSRYSGVLQGTAGRGTGAAAPLEEVLQILRVSLFRHGSDGGLLNLGLDRAPSTVFEEKAAEMLAEVHEGISKETGGGSLLAGIETLVGLGPGFTPSGDDFIAGALAGASFAGAPQTDLQQIRNRLERTTLGGATLLRLACRGSFPEYLVRFVSALGSPPSPSYPGDVERAVRAAVEHGASSGTDALAGFLWLIRKFVSARA